MNVKMQTMKLSQNIRFFRFPPISLFYQPATWNTLSGNPMCCCEERNIEKGNAEGFLKEIGLLR